GKNRNGGRTAAGDAGVQQRDARRVQECDRLAFTARERREARVRRKTGRAAWRDARRLGHIAQPSSVAAGAAPPGLLLLVRRASRGVEGGRGVRRRRHAEGRKDPRAAEG